MGRNRLTACDDFHRTAGARRGAAPAPLTRREVLGLGLGAGVALYLTPGLLPRALEAAAAEPQDGRVLVTLFLPGGLDLLDTIVPLHQYSAYRDARGLHARPQSSPRLGSTGLGMHDALTRGNRGGLRGLFDAGKLGLLPGIDYANPNLSHFDSRAFWETGLVTKDLATGWLGRWADRFGSADNPFQGVSLGSSVSPLLRTGGAPVAAVESPRSVRLSAPLSATALNATVEAYARLGAAGSARPGRDAVNRAVRLTKRVADDLGGREAEAPQPAAPASPGLPAGIVPAPPADDRTPQYPPTRMGDRFRTLAFLLAQPLGVRLAAITAEGVFDTHAGQGPTLEQWLTDVSQSLSAFQLDLEQRGLADRVLTLTWSEFGRRVKGNASDGTDHGAGGIAWVQGTQARAGVLTDYPSLTDLDPLRNLKVTVDFRQVYASLLEQWLVSDAGAVIPRAAELGRVQLVR